MSANKFTESLTRENAAVVFVDHQVGLYSGVRDIAVGELKHNVVALAKAARVFKLPLVVTTTAARSMWGPTIPELAGSGRFVCCYRHGVTALSEMLGAESLNRS